MSTSNPKAFWVSVSFSTQGLHDSTCPPAALGASDEKLEKMLLKLPEIISGSALKSQAFSEVGWFCFLLSLVVPWLTLSFSNLFPLCSDLFYGCYQSAAGPSSLRSLSHPFSSDLLRVTVRAHFSLHCIAPLFLVFSSNSFFPTIFFPPLRGSSKCLP